MTIADMIIQGSYRLDGTLPYIPEEGPEPDAREVLQSSLFICNCPADTPHRH